MTCLDEQHPKGSGTEQMIMGSYTSNTVYRNTWSDRGDRSDRANAAMHIHIAGYT